VIVLAMAKTAALSSNRCWLKKRILHKNVFAKRNIYVGFWQVKVRMIPVIFLQ